VLQVSLAMVMAENIMWIDLYAKHSQDHMHIETNIEMIMKEIMITILMIALVYSQYYLNQKN
jgi:hypothetical protein